MILPPKLNAQIADANLIVKENLGVVASLSSVEDRREQNAVAVPTFPGSRVAMVAAFVSQIFPDNLVALQDANQISQDNLDVDAALIFPENLDVAASLTSVKDRGEHSAVVVVMMIIMTMMMIIMARAMIIMARAMIPAVAMSPVTIQNRANLVVVNQAKARLVNRVARLVNRVVKRAREVANRARILANLANRVNRTKNESWPPRLTMPWRPWQEIFREDSSSWGFTIDRLREGGTRNTLPKSQSYVPLSLVLSIIFVDG